jgi:hypothetical protein
MPQAPSQYFAPSFFSQYYFPPLVDQAGGTGGAAISPYRDGNAFDAIIAALVNTGEFAAAVFGTTPDRMAAGSDVTPLAVITPEAWVELDDVDPVVIVRQVDFSLTIVVRGEEPTARYGHLDRLSCVAINAVDGLDLGGACLPGLTRIRRGRYEFNTKHPEQRLLLTGEFSYLIPSLTGHNTSD